MVGIVILLMGLSVSAKEFSAQPPPGWEDVTAHKSPEVVVALQGPQTSSFVLTRIAAQDLDNRSSVHAFLIDVLSALNKRTGLGFTLAGPLRQARFDNGLSIQYISANHNASPRLILGVVSDGRSKLLATLISSIPDTLLPSIMDSLRDTAKLQGLPAAPAKSSGEDNFWARIKKIIYKYIGYGSDQRRR